MNIYRFDQKINSIIRNINTEKRGLLPMKKFVKNISITIIAVFVIFFMVASSNKDKIEKNQDILPMANTVEETLTTQAAVQVDTSYPKILKPSADQIEFAYQSDGIFCIWTGEKFGFMDEDGRELAPYIYDSAYPFNEGLACVMKDGKYGFIDKDGNEKIPFIYDKATPFSEGLAYFEIEDTYGFINQLGEEIFVLDCDSVSSFKEGRAFFSVNGKYGYIDCNGKKVIDNVYDDAHYFKAGLAKVRVGGYTGVIDTDGKEIIPAEYDSVQIDEKYIITIKDDVETYFDFAGKKIISPKDDDRISVGNHLYIVCQDQKYGITDDQGEIKVPFKYDYISKPYTENGDSTYVIIRTNDKCGILTLSDFNETISPTYDSIDTFHEGYATVYLDGMYGLIDENGSIVIPIGEYDYIFSVYDSLLCLLKEDRYYLAENNGEKISSKYYDNINQFSKVGDFQIFEKNGKKGLLDSTGNEVVSASYDYISGSYGNVYHSNTSFITTNYSDSVKNHIIVVGEYQNIDLSDITLVNVITPKLQPYHDLIQKSITESGFPALEFSATPSAASMIKTVKLFNVADYEDPILYYYTEPVIGMSFPASDSAFYCIENNQAKELVIGNECGGSARGNYVQLYFEKETGKILLGTNGFYGGFGGYSSDVRIYKNNKEYLSIQWIGQSSQNFPYDETYLLKNAHLFYDDDGNPLSKENILEVQYMSEYSINEETVSVEDYENELGKYILIPMT